MHILNSKERKFSNEEVENIRGFLYFIAKLQMSNEENRDFLHCSDNVIANVERSNCSK